MGDPEATLSFDDSLERFRQDIVVIGVAYYSDWIQTKSTWTKAPRTEPRGNRRELPVFLSQWSPMQHRLIPQRYVI